MNTEVEKALNIIENISQSLKKTKVNLGKCPKARLTRSYIEARLQCIEEYWSDYKQAHNEVLRHTPRSSKDQVPYLSSDEYYECEELFISLKAELNDILFTKECTRESKDNMSVNSDVKQTRVMLPKIQLPTFSGNYEEWMSFHDLFITLIHDNPTLNNVQKIHYLKTTLTGEAASLLRHIQVVDSNYNEAWQLLKSRYGNKRITTNAIMKRFFSQKRVTTHSSGQIKSILDTTFECLHHLNNLNIKTEGWDPMIIFVVVQKLDTETHKLWEEYASSHLENLDSLPTLEMLKQFLENSFRTLELIEPSKAKYQVASSPAKEKVFHISTNIDNDKKCNVCKADHTISHCKEFSTYTPTQRSEFVRDNHLCYNCLALGHTVRQCRIPVNCRICKKRHHSLLHEHNKKTNTEEEDSQKQTESDVTLHTCVEALEEENEDRDITTLASHVVTKRSTGLLATAMVNVTSGSGFSTVMRALIDQGSQASFISERGAQLLQAKKSRVKGTVIGVGSTKSDIKHIVQVEIQSRCEQYSLKINTYVMTKQITTRLPTHTMHTDAWHHLKGLQLADEEYNQPGPIDLLLGVDVYAQIIENKLIKGPPGSPCAQKTNLGWILFGEVKHKPDQTDSIMVMHHQIDTDDFLKQFWEVEHDTRRKYTKEEQYCEMFYDETYTRNENGRYVVALPFRSKERRVTKGNSKEIALKRLLHLEHRFNKYPKLKEEYDQVLEEYLDMDHMEEVPAHEIEKESVYLSHHAIVRRDKETTKMRVVFDASCKDQNGISLNDELLVGPVLQDDLRGIIMRWRMHKICFISDITKMYRMIQVRKEDTDFQRILRRRGGADAEVKHYRLRTVTFGTASAPYLAVKTLIKTTEDEDAENEIINANAARIIREDFYIDDLISGADNALHAIDVAKHIQRILRKGGFELQKWASNSEPFLRSIESNRITTKAKLDLKLDGIIKALGISWAMGEDELHYELQLEPNNNKITKRTILSDIQKLFDPLGWIAPIIIKAKILIQKLWLTGIGWDDRITEDIAQEWKTIRLDLEKVKGIKIQRWLNTSNNEGTQATLHGFCDASIKAYAAVVYCRVVTAKGEIRTHLVAVKTRVAPVKTISLPRLELCGATLLADLLCKVSHAMRIPIQHVFAWTDSTIVLAWLLGEPNRWKAFVANRVVEIIDRVSSAHWFHVSSADNPADIGSRGSFIEDFEHNDLWWKGPTWLSESHIEFKRPSDASTELEIRKLIQTNTGTVEIENKFIAMENFDSLSELLRVMVHCRRFLNFKRNASMTYITVEELQRELQFCIKRVQEEEFTNDIQRLKDKKPVSKSSMLKALTPYLDDKNILKVGGRLRNAGIDDTQKHPIILGRHNELVPLLIADAHHKTLHGGIQMTVAYLVNKYWILQCKSLVKKYIRGCLICAKQRAAIRPQMMGDLPAVRVTPSRPFSRSGVDFAGPVQVLNCKGRGAKTNKAYICIFICMAVKAIHLELVSDLSADAFIAAFRRFVSRRGRCLELWSDNATNFVASNKELCALWKERSSEMPGPLAEILATDGTQWHFIPPYSPNFGGLWEAGVRSVKHHLRRVLTSNLTFEEYSTVLTQIEACLNSRPLIPISTVVDSVEDLQILTPGHFLVGEHLIVVPDHDYTSQGVSGMTRWQHTQRLVQQFWKRWQNEYLSLLNQRPKWQKRLEEYNIGDIVLLKEENLPPSKWPLARIVTKHPGLDGLTRVYTVRYNGKLTQRSISRLCPLPINQETNQSSSI